MQFGPGTVLGRYELLMPLAQGGMATVWAARLTGSHGFEKTVAIKTMLPSLSEDPAFETMFLNEARLSMRVVHPNVVQVLDLGQTAQCVCMVLEWVDGESLSTLLRVADPMGGIPLRLAMSICIQVCAGLHAAHEVGDDDDRPLGIVHRDVSPQNVMVSYQGFVKVVDFGIAKAEEHFVTTTRTGQFKGKVPYMSPEQASGGVVDRRTDIFALGTMLYRMTTGVHPFSGPNDLATLNNLLNTTVRPPTSIVADYPPELEAIVLRCMAKDASQRFSTMAEVKQRLEAVQQKLGAPVMESETAAFVTTLLGERRRQRKHDMRAAAKSLGWNVATSESLPRASVEPAPGSWPTARYGPGGVSLTPSHPTGVSAAGRSQAPTFGGVYQDATASRARSRLLLAFGMIGAAAGVAIAVMLFAGRTGEPAPRERASATQASPAEPPPAVAIPESAVATSSPPAAVSAAATSPPSAAPLVPASAAAAPPARPPRPPVAGTATAKPPAGDDGPDLGF